LEVLLIFFDNFNNFNNHKQKSHYETLGVAKTAADAEIKRAYFGLVRKYQPDRFPEEFKEIRAAYETLMDRQKRAEYDAIGDLPDSVAPLFHRAQHFDRFGRHDKAAELYQTILKSNPELDKVREYYAKSFLANNKIGKAGEVWEELCRRHPDNAFYARELGNTYLDRGWHKKALSEAQRALALDRSSIDGWILFISAALEDIKKEQNRIDKFEALSVEALEAVKAVKVNEWGKIHLYTYAFIAGDPKKSDVLRGYLREIIRLIREGGRAGQREGLNAFTEILNLPSGELTGFYPELKEMSDLIPDIKDTLAWIRLDAIRLDAEMESLVGKGFPEIFCDLFRILNADDDEEVDEVEILLIEYFILKDKHLYDRHLRRLKEEFPELYDLHRSFFNEALRTRNPEKMMYQRSKKIKKLERESDISDDDSDSEQPIRRAQPKVGRNDPCPCGSGKKYKKCCGA
jgi:tetratricopeptide (TPR) repeat protein